MRYSLLFFLLLPLVFVVTARAVDINPSLPGMESGTDPAGIVANLYQFALLLGGILAFGSIVYGGIRYTLAAGNSSTQGDARDQITQALLGLLLLFGVYLIFSIINPGLTVLGLPSLAPLQIGGGTNMIGDDARACGCDPATQVCQIQNGSQRCVSITPPTTPTTCRLSLSDSGCPAGQHCVIDNPMSNNAVGTCKPG